MSISLDESLFSNKQYLLNDLKYCLNYLNILKSYAIILKNDPKFIPEDVGKWLDTHEALKEKTQKILINCKEEWRLVLKSIPIFMENLLDILKLSNPHEKIFDMALDFLRSLSLCVNSKRLARYWPTEVEWFLKIYHWLDKYLSNYSSSADFSSTTILILMLASSVKTPFDLSRFDKSNDNESISLGIANIIDKNIENYSLYPVIHILAASYYSRPDCHQKLSKFIEKLLLIIMNGQCSINSKLCVLRIIATILKFIDRLIMLKHVDYIVDMITNNINQKHEQYVKLCMKICGRAALVHLKPSTQFKWKYRCGKRVTKLTDTKTILINDDKKDDGDDDKEFEINLPDYFENLIELLMANLVHKHTTVRFSVAKYLAKIGARLPFQYSDQMLEHIFNLCSSTAEDHYWHGSCLAIAEFVRHGYVQIDSMPIVIKILDEALFFEIIKGSFSSGSHVRDAACYICWSMARAYDGKVIASFVAHLAPHLINVACFDREINCRRAASAVIQELAGRTQNFPHWVEVISKTEFYQLNKIEHTYIDIGAHFAITYDEFRSSIIENILFKKCTHWDSNIRQLAAQAVGKISKKCPFLDEPYFDKLFNGHLKNLKQFDLNHQHGYFIAISYLLEADASLNSKKFITERVFEIFNDQWLALQSMSSFSANLIRESLLIFVNKCLPLLAKDNNKEKIEIIESFLVDSIESNEANELIQCKTTDAALCFLTNVHYLDLNNKFFIDLINLFSKKDQFIISTLAKLFSQFVPKSEKISEHILKEFVNYLEKYFDDELRRSETIADVSRALLKFISSNSINISNSDLQAKVHKNVMKCLNDHSITKKGDTGLQVRYATIDAIYEYSCLVDSGQLLDIIQSIATEAALHRDLTFVLSMKQLARICQHCLNSKLNLNQLANLNVFQMADMELYEECIKMLEYDLLTKHLLSGFVCVLADPILDKYSKLIINYIKNSLNRDKILTNFIMIFNDNAKCKRLSISCLVSANLLLTQIPTSEPFQKEICKFAWLACEKTLNPKKYMLACDIFCSLTLLGRLSLSSNYLHVLLGHRLPCVRHYASVQLCASILSLDTDNQLMELVYILQQTDWSNLNEAKRKRDQIGILINKFINELSLKK